MASPLNDNLEPQVAEDQVVATYYTDTGCNNGAFSVKRLTVRAFHNCYTTVPNQGLKAVKFHEGGRIFDNAGCSGGGNSGALEDCIALGGANVRGLKLDHL